MPLPMKGMGLGLPKFAIPSLSLATAKAIVREETVEGAAEIDYGMEAKLITERLQAQQLASLRAK